MNKSNPTLEGVASFFIGMPINKTQEILIPALNGIKKKSNFFLEILFFDKIVRFFIEIYHLLLD